MRKVYHKIKAVFLDRDGVINEYPGHSQYVTKAEDFKLLPGVKPALERLIKHGFRLFVVSNQAGVSKGLYSQEALDAITAHMVKELGAGIPLGGIYYCTHRSEDNCSCRKPRTGLIDAAVAGLARRKESIDRAASFFVGDSIVDMQTGKAAGLTTVLVFSGKEQPQNRERWETGPDFVAGDLASAVTAIIAP